MCHELWPCLHFYFNYNHLCKQKVMHTIVEIQMQIVNISSFTQAQPALAFADIHHQETKSYANK